MEPAYPLQLTKDQHVLIGEIVEILGQCDHIMIQTIIPLDQQAANEMKQSLNVKNLVSPWTNTIRSRTCSRDVLKLIDFTVRERKEIADARNDFIHALITGDYVAPGYVQPGYQATSAIRFKTGKARPTSQLQDLRDRAAMLSCAVAHIGHCINSSDPSPWFDRARSLLA